MSSVNLLPFTLKRTLPTLHVKDFGLYLKLLQQNIRVCFENEEKRIADPIRQEKYLLLSGAL